MRAPVRSLLRLLALLLLLALLVGVPIAVVTLVGVPLPSLAQWRAVWRTHRVDTDVVVRAGAAVFLLLWAWFAVTALAELRRVLPHRRDPEGVPQEGGRGPSALVCGLVRFVAVSSVGASVLTGGLAGLGHAEGHAPGREAVTHAVVPGDSYWDIAEGHLDHTLGRDATNQEVMALTQQLVAMNAPVLGHRDRTLLLPGETVVIVPAAVEAFEPGHVPLDQPVRDAVPHLVEEQVAVETVAPSAVDPAAPAPAVPATTVTSPAAAGEPAAHDDRSALPGLAGALLLAGGALITLETRRRRRLRSAAPGAVLRSPTFAQARTELLLRSLDPAEQLARLDMGLRAAANELATQGAVVIAVTIGDTGDVTLHLRGAALPTSPHWRADIARGVWHLAAGVTLEDLAVDARDGVMPCPALVHLGTTDDGAALFVDLEALGAVAVPAGPGRSLALAVAAGLAASPFRSGGTLRVAGLDGVPTSPAVQVEHDVHVALAAARADAALVGAWAAGSSTFALRATTEHPESWEPSLLVLGGDCDAPPSLLDVVGGAGLGVFVVGDAPAPVRLHQDGDHLVFEELGLRFQPCAVTPTDLDAVADLLAVTPAFDERAEVARAEPAAAALPAAAFAEPAFAEPEWDLLVRTIGQVFVESADGSIAEFERSKSLELVVWMALHRERSTRSGARSAMWEVGVRSATFANVVSEARRALGALVQPREGEDWIGRTLTDDLPLHPRVITDADLLQARLDASRGVSPAQAIEVLRPGLELVTGLPFCSPCFAWVDGEGHTSALVLLATGAAVELAQHHLALGDIDGVFWATGQGLKVLPGHEALIALRMRAHASHGDLAGVRLEWEQYERALAADTWSPGEPSPKLVALRRELLGQPVPARVGAPGA